MSPDETPKDRVRKFSDVMPTVAPNTRVVKGCTVTADDLEGEWVVRLLVGDFAQLWQDDKIQARRTGHLTVVRSEIAG